MVSYRPSKRPKVQDVYHLSRFGEAGHPAPFYKGPFRSNVSSFLQDYGEWTASGVEGIISWLFPLQDSAGNRLEVQVLEEHVQEGARLHCDHCRLIGWTHHPVSSRRYHVIVPASDGSEEAPGVGKGKKACPSCGMLMAASAKWCSECKATTTGSGILEQQTHLLHGVLHVNGFGHLLRINGRERGSKFASGKELMDMWDRICILLRARRVSVMDVSKKQGLDFRLLHGVAFGIPWYGKWGYVYGKGSYGVTQSIYELALSSIRSTSLSELSAHFASIDQEVLGIIALYKRLRRRPAAPLNTLADLIYFMHQLLQHPASSLAATPPLLCGPSTPRGNGAANIGGTGLSCTSLQSQSSGAAEKTDAGDGSGSISPGATSGGEESKCRWSAARLEQATIALLEVLKDAEGKHWLSRQALREGARAKIGDTGLLDYVLKGFINKVIDDRIVRRRFNSHTRMLEYMLQPYNGTTDLKEEVADHYELPAAPFPGAPTSPTLGVAEIQRADVQRDLLYLFSRLFSVVPAATTAVTTAAVVAPLDKDLPSGVGGEVYAVCPAPYGGSATRLQEYAQIVLDTKQFVKDYGGELAPLGAGGAPLFGGAGSSNCLSEAKGSLPGSALKDKEGCGKARVERLRGKERWIGGGGNRREDAALGRAVGGAGSACDGATRVLCIAHLDDWDKPGSRNRGKDPPPELLVLQPGASLSDLKAEATKAFRDVYLVLENFHVASVPELPGLEDESPVQGQVPFRAPLRMKGFGADLTSAARFEGSDEWVVSCPCGTQDDDGERMVACDSCEVWLHTRCVGIPDREPPPSSFVCMQCRKPAGSRKRGAGGSSVGGPLGRSRSGTRQVAMLRPKSAKPELGDE